MIVVYALREDQEQAATLRESLRGLGLSIELASLNNTKSLSEALQLYVWSPKAQDEGGSTLRDMAMTALASDSYHGIVLGTNTQPVIDAAHETRVVGFGDVDMLALATVLGGEGLTAAATEGKEVLTEASCEQLPQNKTTPRWLELTERRVDAIKKDRRVVVIAAIAAVPMGIFGLWANVLGSQDAICRPTAMYGVCHTFNLGHLPTPQQRDDWQGIVAGHDCEAFKTYLRKHGPATAYSAEARQRIDLARSSKVKSSEAFSAQVAVTWSTKSFPTYEIARADFERRAVVASLSTCTHLFPGKLIDNGVSAFEEAEAECDSLGGGFRCRGSGHTTCTYVDENYVFVCPEK